MYPRLEGEMAKLIKIDNGWLVVIWNPEAPLPAIPGQAPCAQQPVKWWRTYSFPTLDQAIAFLGQFLGHTAGA